MTSLSRLLLLMTPVTPVTLIPDRQPPLHRSVCFPTAAASLSLCVCDWHGCCSSGRRALRPKRCWDRRPLLDETWTSRQLVRNLTLTWQTLQDKSHFKLLLCVPDVCGFCRKPVPLSEPAIEALNRTYHAACFQCRQCHAPLAAKIYYNKSGIPLCDDCYQVPAIRNASDNEKTF